ncbi:hypothetical protein RFI_32927, partial [Reticulomyxa filosa]
ICFLFFAIIVIVIIGIVIFGIVVIDVAIFDIVVIDITILDIHVDIILFINNFYYQFYRKILKFYRMTKKFHKILLSLKSVNFFLLKKDDQIEFIDLIMQSSEPPLSNDLATRNKHEQYDVDVDVKGDNSYVDDDYTNDDYANDGDDNDGKEEKINGYSHCNDMNTTNNDRTVTDTNKLLFDNSSSVDEINVDTTSIDHNVDETASQKTCKQKSYQGPYDTTLAGSQNFKMQEIQEEHKQFIFFVYLIDILHFILEKTLFSFFIGDNLISQNTQILFFGVHFLNIKILISTITSQFSVAVVISSEIFFFAFQHTSFLNFVSNKKLFNQ